MNRKCNSVSSRIRLGCHPVPAEIRSSNCRQLERFGLSFGIWHTVDVTCRFGIDFSWIPKNNGAWGNIKIDERAASYEGIISHPSSSDDNCVRPDADSVFNNESTHASFTILRSDRHSPPNIDIGSDGCI